MPNTTTPAVLKRLQIIFTVSTIILLTSTVASFYSLQKMTESSGWVNHTYQVLAESENLLSLVKDAETTQRGYLLSHDPIFLDIYQSSLDKSVTTYENLKKLTNDNPAQQTNLDKLWVLIQGRFKRLEEVLELDSNQRILNNEKANANLYKGKQQMDLIRAQVNEIKEIEEKLLKVRLSEQEKFVGYTPVLIVIASLISIIITFMAYQRIRQDIYQQLAKQKAEAEQYEQTVKRIAHIQGVTRKISSGDFDARSTDISEDELGKISTALNSMASVLQKNFEETQKRAWISEGSVKIGNAIRGQRDVNRLAGQVLSTMAEYMEIPLATFYVKSNYETFKLEAAYASSNAPALVHTGEGLTGQAIRDERIIVLNDLQDYHQQVRSSTGQAAPTYLYVIPYIYEEEVIGVIEVAFLKKPEEKEVELLENVRESIAIGINSALTFRKLQELLEETQSQAEELEAQHSEMENLNTELETQAEKLQASEEELKVQQEELLQSNSELEERASQLEEKNLEIFRKAEELETATRYKSEFLANMSHELRTPLNSILLLSRLLKENDDKNLNADQVEYARVIQNSGSSLLDLIDEILDLSKIEAGKMEPDYTDVPVKEMVDDLHGLFKPLAKEKNINLEIHVGETIPETIETDKIRLEQILKNLLSNAVKFTNNGSVSLNVEPHETRRGIISFVVKDSGIGIAGDKQAVVFEAFRQADGSTKRKYGGTGLGLSISRELAKLLGGEITLSSEPEKGSTFTVNIPVRKPDGLPAPANEYIPLNKTSGNAYQPSPDELRYVSSSIPENVPDDRDQITANDKSILIVEDDVNFAKSLLDFTRKKGYKGIVSVRGDEALPLALKYHPIGILLDIQLPVKSGLQAMDELKTDPGTRHIPIHIMSSHKMKNQSLLKGAVDFIDKPFAIEQMKEIFRKIEDVKNKSSKKVVIIEDNNQHARALAYFLETHNIVSEVKSDLKDSVEALKKEGIDCVILDMGIPDQKSYTLLEEIKKTPELETLPVIIFTGKSLSMAEEQRIKRYADTIVVKTAHSYQRMYDEVSLFLHLVAEKNPANSQTRPDKMVRLGGMNEILNNKTVLIVDDDVRNIFSLSKALEKFRMNIVTAIDGKEALQKLVEHPETDIVLLDMMMPEMDGYETAKNIRANHQWKKLPVIAVTAKAMVGDREKCINAGASDYITKPVDVDQLLSLLRVWLYGA